MNAALDLGSNCKECLCSTCEYLLGCSVMCGNTFEWCRGECRGEASWTNDCNGYGFNRELAEEGIVL
mgnify:CR=1 FL=1